MSIRVKLIILLLLFSVLLILHVNVQTKTKNESEFEYYIELDKQIVLTKYCGSKSVVTVPAVIDGYMVKSTENTFANNKKIEKVIFSNGITSIGSETFSNCSNLTKVYIPDSIEILGNYAFSGTALSSLTLPENTSYIGIGCFYNCKYLKFVKAKAESLWISELAFFNSKLELMQLTQTPYYYANSFSQVCNFSYNPVVTFTMRHELLYTIYSFTKQQPFHIKALLIVFMVIILTSIFFLPFVIIKIILIVLRKDKLQIYKDYNKKCQNNIGLQNNTVVFIYKKPHFVIDAIKFVLAAIVILILSIGGLVEISLFLINLLRARIYSFWLLLLVSLTSALLGLIFYIIITFFAIKIYFIISPIFSEIFFNQRNSVKTRIRKIRKVR